MCAASARLVARARIVATEACRRAANARGFLRRVRRETGLDIEVITPEQEARLLALVVVQGGCLAASRLRQSCRFFGRSGGYEAMEAGCRAAVAEGSWDPRPHYAISMQEKPSLQQCLPA